MLSGRSLYTFTVSGLRRRPPFPGPTSLAGRTLGRSSRACAVVRIAGEPRRQAAHRAAVLRVTAACPPGSYRRPDRADLCAIRSGQHGRRWRHALDETRASGGGLLGPSQCQSRTLKGGQITGPCSSGLATAPVIGLPVCVERDCDDAANEDAVSSYRKQAGRDPGSGRDEVRLANVAARGSGR